MDFDQWAIDAGLSDPPVFCFCPVSGDVNGEHKIVFGLNLIQGDLPPGKVVCVVHPDGQGACEQWVEDNAEHLNALFNQQEEGGEDN